MLGSTHLFICITNIVYVIIKKLFTLSFLYS
uniref:Uncharacterized protein n=1 Tax=Myoviridae sp. ctkfK18 TaxID=2825165 RepID=A0A8S5VGU8_9CAUD|nr:MAG TPA: hypothetical protein [Myoviridae sp. ctkfK18]